MNVARDDEPASTIRVYRMRDFGLHRRVAFPPIQRTFPQHFGVLDDARLGFRHPALRVPT